LELGEEVEEGLFKELMVVEEEGVEVLELESYWQLLFVVQQRL
jgi:hypothetical protein